MTTPEEGAMGGVGDVQMTLAVDMDDARMIATAPRMYRLLSHIISCPEAEAEWLDELYEVMAQMDKLPEPVVPGVDRYAISGDDLRRMVEHAQRAIAEKDAEIAQLRAEIERLQKLVEPEWFYPGGEHDGENCYSSEREAVQEVLEWDARPGDVVVIEIARATSLPPVWACAKKLADHNWPTEGEWFTFTVHESEEEAEAQKAVLEGEKADG